VHPLYATQPAFEQFRAISINEVLELAPLRIQVWSYWSARSKGVNMPLFSPPISYKNRLLASLPADAIQQLTPHLAPIDLPTNRILEEANQAADGVYFLEGGICSVVARMENGASVEVGVIGRDGFVGLSAVLGSGCSPNRYFMQIPGYGFRVKARVLTELADRCTPLRMCLLRSMHGLLVQTAQIAACNRLHELQERLARWLLMRRDRLQSDHILVTQEFLATMLGTRRSSVTVAVGILQKAGLITCTRGRVSILNNAGLADASCECYQVVHDEYVRLGLLEARPVEFKTARVLRLAIAANA
jgi:CRP-like cAMP-binding protein